mgnify:CR=1 FL=1
MKIQRLFIIGAAIITIGIFLSPIFRPGIIAGHDAGYHFTRVQLFTQAFKEGQFPVRWIEGPVPGITHPLFEFYPPLFYYFVAPLMLLGIPYTIATYAVIIFTTVLAWVGMYLFVKNVIASTSMSLRAERSNLSVNSAKQSLGIATSSGTPPRNDMIAAAFAATLFLFTPYRISQLYVRAAYGEFLATAFVPLAFLAMYNKNILLLAFSLAAMVMSHQPTAIIVAVPLALWALYNFLRTGQVRGLVHTGIAGLLAFGLSAFFTIPLIAESGLIRAARLSTGYFDFRAHFAELGQLIYSAWGYGVSMRGAGDGMSLQVGIINWVVILGTVVLVLYNYKALSSRDRSDGVAISHQHGIAEPVPSGSGRRLLRFARNDSEGSPRNDNLNIIFFLIITVFGVGMATTASEPFWERFSVLGYIQYPWRFLLIVSFATSALGGLIFYNLYNRYKNYNRYSFLLLFIPILFNLKYLAPAAYMPAGTFNLNNPELARYNSPENPFFGVELGYFPIWVSEVNTDPNVKRFTVIAGTAEVTATADFMTRQQARVEATQAATIRINTHYFPGWMATIDDGKTKKTVVPAYNNSLGNMEINLTPGDYKLSLNLTQTPVRRFADYLSLGTAVGVAVWMLLMISPKRFWSKYKGATSPARVKRSKA